MRVVHKRSTFPAWLCCSSCRHQCCDGQFEHCGRDNHCCRQHCPAGAVHGFMSLPNDWPDQPTLLLSSCCRALYRFGIAILSDVTSLLEPLMGRKSPENPHGGA